jgi:hypothetical protein
MIYDFRYKGTEEYFQLSMPMSDREKYLEDNPNVEQVLLVAPPLADPMRLGRMNPAQRNFQKNVIGRMRDSLPGNNLKDSKFQIPREI